jgi:hypothetical protein
VAREGISVTAPLRSILDAAKAGAAPEQIEMSVRQAIAGGLVSKRSLVEHAERLGGRVAYLVRGAIEESRVS